MKQAFVLSLLSASALLLSSCATTSVAGGAKPYPLDTCIVTDNKLGSMGPVVTQTHEGQEVKFCCKPCVAKFKDNPGRYLAKLNS